MVTKVIPPKKQKGLWLTRLDCPRSSEDIQLHKLKTLCGLAASAVVFSGCGGSGTDIIPTPLNSSTRVIVGYVYVSTGLVAVTPDTIITNSSTPPAGYAAPTSGTVTLFVTDGVITRASDTEVFQMTSGNSIIATVTSRDEGTPKVRYGATGLQYNSVARTAIPNTNLNMGGTNGSLLTLNYQDSALNYTPGPAASIQVLIKDPNGTNKFEAPSASFATIIPTANEGDVLQVAVIAKDANGIVIPGTTAIITDPNSNATESAVVQTVTTISAGGSGVEGVSVPVRFTVSGADGLAATYSTTYTYGNSTNFVATIELDSIAAPTRGFVQAGLNWNVGTATPQANLYVVLLQNGRGINVPNRAFSLRRKNTAGTVQFNYAVVDSPFYNVTTAPGDETTNAQGRFFFDLLAPASADGNVAHNTANIKYLDNTIEALVNSNVVGSTTYKISRNLDSLTIAGASRLDVGTTSKATGTDSFRVTGAVDVDTEATVAPSGSYSWDLSNTGALPPAQIGDPDNLSNRSESASTGSSSTSSIVVGAGPSAGMTYVTCSFGSVDSNQLAVGIYGPPSKVRITPTPNSFGLFGNSAGDNIAMTASYIDSYGHSLGSEVITTAKTGTVTSSGSTLTFPSLPSLVYNVTTPASGTSIVTMTLSGTWTGTGQGTSVGSSSWNLSRNVNIALD